MTPYQERCIAQLRRWVEGHSEHNRIDDECCPDFSCCNPKLFTQDRGERLDIMNKYLQRCNQPKQLDS